MGYAALYTGGKDSTRALHWALEGGLEVECLVTMIPERRDSWMFHTPALNVIDLLAESIGIPLIKRGTRGVKEEEVKDLESLLSKLDVDGLISGSLASEYQRVRIKRICKKLSLKLLTPFWGYDQRRFMEELLKLRYRIMVVAVSALGLNERWLGRVLDHQALKELIRLHERYKINVAFEGGEAETLVLDCPIYRKRLEVLSFDKVWNGRSGYITIREAKLSSKG